MAYKTFQPRMFKKLRIEILLIWLLIICEVESSSGKETYVARCPPPLTGGNTTTQSSSTSQEPAYCQCNLKSTKSTTQLQIQCDFKYERDVVLTDALYAFYKSGIVNTSYVRIVNATGVTVSASFLMAWLQAPSSALDIWRGGKVILESTPELNNLKEFQIYKTFVGVGIIECQIPEIPTKFLRDRNRGALRIKGSVVDIFRDGMIHNIEEMRYLVVEDSSIKEIHSHLSNTGTITLSARTVHSWNGLLFKNVSIGEIDSSAFNITHKSDMESVVIDQCHVTHVGKTGLTAIGDIEVTITNSVFSSLNTHAFEVLVTGNVSFSHNTIENFHADALEGLQCHNQTRLEQNTLYIETDMGMSGKDESTPASPFHSTCGIPQVFYYVSATTMSPQGGRGGATLVVLSVMVALLLVGVAMTASWVWWRRHPFFQRYHNNGSNQDTTLLCDNSAKGL